MVRFIRDTPVIQRLSRSVLSLPSAEALRYCEAQCCDKKPGVQKLFMLQAIWQIGGCPFFEVYPKVAEGLSRTPLDTQAADIPRTVIHDLGVLCVKFPLGMMPGIDFAFLSAVHEGLNRIENRTDFFVIYEDRFAWNTIEPGSLPSQREEPFHDLAMSVLIGVMFLASDPEIIKPILIKKDARKHPTDERIQRARRRGVYGFTVGEDIERSPHWRRPHFAIRWTGKCGKIPKLVPVKAACVGKEKLLNIPTGYEGATQ